MIEYESPKESQKTELKSDLKIAIFKIIRDLTRHTDLSRTELHTIYYSKKDLFKDCLYELGSKLNTYSEITNAEFDQICLDAASDPRCISNTVVVIKVV
jgi:hypothetical protein